MKTLLCSLLVCAAAGCAATSSMQSGDAIKARSDAWEAAFDARDMEGVLAHYADRTRFMPPHAEMGAHATVRQEIGGMMDAGFVLDLHSLEARVSGDIGYHVGTYSLHAADGRLQDRGKFMEIWQLVGGQWKITNDIYNSDLPAPSP